jgi:hypothetical protein
VEGGEALDGPARHALKEDKLDLRGVCNHRTLLDFFSLEGKLSCCACECFLEEIFFGAIGRSSAFLLRKGEVISL